VNKREKIIVGVMCAAVVLGAYIFFFSSPSGKGGGSPGTPAAGETIEEVLKKVAATLGEVTVTDADRFVIAGAEAAWQADPFFEKKKEKASSAVEDAANLQTKIDVKYTGFIEMGTRRLAIINGQEYEPGEELPPGGIVLKKIDPDQVIVETVAEKRSIAVKIVEEKL
jgi:hypothetical protein